MNEVNVTMAGRNGVGLDHETIGFLRTLLSETREQFRERFLAMANSQAKKDQRKFVAIYTNLSELINPRPIVTIPYQDDEEEA